MNVLESSFDYDDLRAVGKKIDEGILYLEKKLLSVTNLGLSTDPERTKLEAENVLKDYEDEIEEVKINLESCIKAEEDLLSDNAGNNERVSNFIQQVKTDLHDLEVELAAGGNYQIYQPVVEHQNSDVNETEQIQKDCDILNGNVTSEHCNETADENVNNISGQYIKSNIAQHSPTNSSQYTDTLDISSNSYFMTPLAVKARNLHLADLNSSKESSRFFEKSFDRSNGESHNNSTMFATKKSNYLDDVCKTPIDPGVSVTSMKLLAKSNVKIKVYKTAVPISSQVKAEN